MKSFLTLFFLALVTLTSVRAQEGVSQTYLNKDSFIMVRDSFRQMAPRGSGQGGMMRVELFQESYGLFFEILKQIDDIYMKGVLPEGSQTFRDLTYYMTYLYFSSYEYLYQDYQVPALRPFLQNSCFGMVKLLGTYGWKLLVYEEDNTSKIYSSGENNLDQVNCFDRKKKAVHIEGTGRTKVFLRPLEIILKDLVVPENLKAFVDLAKQKTETVLKASGGDMSRPVDTSARELIKEYLKVSAQFDEVMSASLQQGLPNYFQLRNIKNIMIALMELKNVGQSPSAPVPPAQPDQNPKNGRQ